MSEERDTRCVSHAGPRPSHGDLYEDPKMNLGSCTVGESIKIDLLSSWLAIALASTPSFRDNRIVTDEEFFAKRVANKWEEKEIEIRSFIYLCIWDEDHHAYTDRIRSKGWTD